MYGLKKAGKIWGSLLLSHFLSWKFEQTATHPRALIYRRGSEVIIILVVVDDMMFVKNSNNLLDAVKAQLEKDFDVKFFGSISSFIGWDISRSLFGIECWQKTYSKRLIAIQNLNKANGTWKLLPVNSDFRPAQPGEVPPPRR